MKKKEKINEANLSVTTSNIKNVEGKLNDAEQQVSIDKNGNKLQSKIDLLVASTLIAFITFALFSSVLTADFLFWDDDWIIFQNPKLGILNLQNLWSILADNTVSTSFYTPLTGLRWCIIYTFWGLNPFAYHLGNLLFHTANAVMIFFIVRTLVIISLENKQSSEITQLRIDVAALLAALIWAIHPLRVEPVAWAACGNHVQAIFFMLFSLLCYFRYNEDKTRYFRWLIISVACYGASVLSMPITLAFPAVLIVLDVYPLKRIVMINDWWKSQETHRAVLDKIPFISVALVVGVANLTLVSSGRPLHEYVALAKFGLLDRIMQAFYIWAYYAWRPFYPVNLSPVYSMLFSFDPLSLPFVCSAIGVIGATILLLLFRKKYPSILAAWLYYLIMLLPVLGLNVHPHYPSDRYALSVSIIWSVLLAGWIVTVRKSFLPFLLSGFILILIVLGIMSNQQIRIWHNTETLYRYILAKTNDEPDFPLRGNIYAKQGTYYMKKGKDKEAISPLTTAIRLQPDCQVCYINRGIVYGNLGQYQRAIKDFNEAIRLKPDDAMAYNNRGYAYFLQGNNNLGCSDAQKTCELGNCNLLAKAKGGGYCR